MMRRVHIRVALRAAGLLGVALAAAAVAQTADEAAPPDGAALFAHNCALCHQSDAAGLTGMYPRLAGRIGHISAKPAGRAYLIDVVSYGMAGQVTVDHQSIMGVMPALGLSDEEAAKVLSYVESLGNTRPTPFTAAEVTAQRTKPKKSATDVHAERETLQSAKIIE